MTLERVLFFVYNHLTHRAAADPDVRHTQGDVPQSNLRFTHLTTTAGLSQRNVTAILQDHQGFMWFATRDGLNRDDGNTFVVYKHTPDDPESISDEFFLKLAQSLQHMVHNLQFTELFSLLESLDPKEAR